VQMACLSNKARSPTGVIRYGKIEERRLMLAYIVCSRNIRQPG